MKTSISLKHIWIVITVFSILVPITIITLWYSEKLYYSELNSALLIKRLDNENLRNDIEAEITRFQTTLKNKSDPLALLMTNKSKESLQDIYSYLDLIVEREAAIREAIIISKSGEVIAAIEPEFSGKRVFTRKELEAIAVHWGYTEEIEYPEIIIPLLGRQYIGAPERHEDFYAFRIATPIGNPAQAVLIVNIDTARLWSNNSTNQNDNSDYMLDRRGTLVTNVEGSNNKQGALMTHLEIVRTALIDGDWPLDKVYTGVKNKPVFGTMTYIPLLHWSLVSEVNAEQITTPIDTLLYKVVLFTLIGVLSFILLVLIIVGKTLKPLENTQAAVNDIAEGNFDLDLEASGIKELDAMILDVNKMAVARQHAEQSLYEQEKDLSITINSIADGLITIDENGTVLIFNDTAANIFGYKSNEIIGQNVKKLMPEKYSLHHDDYLHRYLETNEPHVIGHGAEVEGLHKNGSTFPLRLSLAELPRGSDGERRFIASCQDLSLLQEQQEQLRRSQKMEALGKLTGGIAHDYNNILGIIMGYASLLQKALDGHPKLANFSDEIHSAGERGSKLTKKLLDFSRFKASDNTSVDINAILNSDLHMLETTLTARIKLVFDLEDGLWPVKLDANELEDAILNMSINAMHAMEDKPGQLTFQTRNLQLDPAISNSLNLVPGDYVELSIIDTGCGMDNECKEKIFDPFFTTKGSEGTGLGLSQVYGFIDRSDGEVKVYSEPGKGTKISLYFPRENSSNTTPQSDNTQNEIDLSGTETILVVDDEKALIDLCCVVLKQYGYKTLHAESGFQALKILEQETVDLLLSDVIMPEMDGYKLASTVIERYPDMPVQMVSGFSDNRYEKLDTINRDLQLKLIYKPYQSRVLLTRIRELLDS